MNKSAQLMFVILTGASLVGCNLSSHYMKDDVYSSKTPLVPIGTDMTDETNYAVYAMKRNQNESQTTYSAGKTKFTNASRYTNTRYMYTSLVNPYQPFGWNNFGMHNYGLGYYYGSSYFCNNGFYSPYNYWYSPYSPYNYYSYGGSYYGSHGGSFFTQNVHNANTSISRSAGNINRASKPATPNVNFGNNPRKLAVSTPGLGGNGAVREKANGNTGSTYTTRPAVGRQPVATRPIVSNPNTTNSNDSYQRSSNTSSRPATTNQRNNSSNSDRNFRTSSPGNNSGTMRSSGGSGSSGGRSSGGTTSGGRSPGRR